MYNVQDNSPNEYICARLVRQIASWICTALEYVVMNLFCSDSAYGAATSKRRTSSNYSLERKAGIKSAKKYEFSVIAKTDCDG